MNKILIALTAALLASACSNDGPAAARTGADRPENPGHEGKPGEDKSVAPALTQKSGP